MAPIDIFQTWISDINFYFRVPFKKISVLEKAQHLLINLGYVLGTQPAKYNYETGKLVYISSRAEKFRFISVASISLVVKLLAIFSLVKNTVEQYGYNNSVLPYLHSYSAVSGTGILIDLHAYFNLPEVITLNHSSALYYQRITNAHFRTPLESSKLQKKCGKYLILYYFLFLSAFVEYTLLYLINCNNHILALTFPICSTETSSSSWFYVNHTTAIWTIVQGIIHFIMVAISHSSILFSIGIGAPSVVRIAEIIFEFAKSRLQPESNLASISDNEFILIYKSDYILGILFNSCAGDNLIPTFITLGVICAISYNCAAIWMTGFYIKIGLAFISSAVLTAIFGVVGINAKLLQYRMLALDERKRKTDCKITQRRFKALRVYRCSCGRLYYMDYIFLLLLASDVVQYTVDFLLVS